MQKGQSKIYFPQQCCNSSPGYLVGWNVRSFIACVATVIPDYQVKTSVICSHICRSPKVIRTENHFAQLIRKSCDKGFTIRTSCKDSSWINIFRNIRLLLGAGNVRILKNIHLPKKFAREMFGFLTKVQKMEICLLKMLVK
jgi:hypothetical protein